MVNTMNAKTQKIGLSATFSLLIAISANSAFAAPGSLSSSPLFVSNAVEPNVFLTLDDSGSMDWELMFPENTGYFTSSGGLPSIDGRTKRYWNPAWSSYMYGTNDRDRNIVPPARSTDSDFEIDEDWWVLRNHNVNTLYYNPETTYTPWPGVDHNTGNPLYEAAKPEEVWRDPNDNASGDDSVDLTEWHDYYDDDDNETVDDTYYIPSYYTWTDDDNDGVVENSDTHTLVEIAAGTPEMQNFANWFQYYRKREFATKAAIGGVINNANFSRMGFAVFNKGHKEDVITMSDPDNNLAMLYLIT